MIFSGFFFVFFFQDVSSLVPQEKESEHQQNVQLFEDLSSHNPCENYNECPKMNQDSKENESSEAKPLTISAIKLFSGVYPLHKKLHWIFLCRNTPLSRKVGGRDVCQLGKLAEGTFSPRDSFGENHQWVVGGLFWG